MQEYDNDYYEKRKRLYDDFDKNDDELNEQYNKSTSSLSEKKSSSSGIISEIFSYVKIFAIAIIIAYITTHFIIINAQVPTGSMKNTIMEGDRLIGFRLSYKFSKPERGDIVIFKYPDDETQTYVKRVIGTPGDIVQIANGKVYINNEELEETYLKEPMNISTKQETYVVPEGHYFMMGDNRNSSLDSRYWTNTYVAEDKILAKVLFRYYDGENKHISFSNINEYNLYHLQMNIFF